MLSPHLCSAKLHLPLVTYNNIMRLTAHQLQRFKSETLGHRVNHLSVTELLR